MAIYLKNATYIDKENFEIREGHIRVDDGEDAGIEFVDEIPVGQEVVDCNNKIVTHSFVNGHHHAYSALARGMPPSSKAPSNFMEILAYVWWKLDRALDKEIIKASALYTALACARAGVTFVIDHHSSPSASEGAMEIIRDSFQKVGVNVIPCIELSDRDGLESRKRGLAETESFLGAGNPGLVGLHASFTVSDDLLKAAVELAKRFDSGIHMHVAEAESDQELTVEKYGIRVVERLSQAGVLDFDKTVLAHCLHLKDRERELLKASPAWMVQNADSNLNNRVGFFKSHDLGNNIMLGTDGMYSDMIRSAHSAYYYGLMPDNANPGKIYSRLRGVHRYLEHNKFSGDGDNNLIVFRYDSPTPVNSDNWLAHFFYGLSSAHIECVISNGRLIVQDRNLLTMPEDDILLFAREQGKRLWEKMKSIN